MLRIEIKRSMSHWYWAVYSGNNRILLRAPYTCHKSSAMRTVWNFIATTGMTVMSEIKGEDGTVVVKLSGARALPVTFGK